MIAESLSDGGTIYFCGNGGSSADAQHLVAEFVGRYRADRRPLAAVALGSTQAVASALANDFGYAEAGIAREVDALVRQGDVVVALSTSGRSPNIIAALEMARAKGAGTVAMTGLGHQLDDLANCLIVVDSTVVALIQELHAVLGHVICELVEDQMGFEP
jgi:D-sedoheptulose 7-phosphate isomerase